MVKRKSRNNETGDLEQRKTDFGKPKIGFGGSEKTSNISTGVHFSVDLIVYTFVAPSELTSSIVN